MRGFVCVVLYVILWCAACGARPPERDGAAHELVSAVPPGSCFSCPSWTNLGQLNQLCAEPSKALFDAFYDCTCDGKCLQVCATWCSSMEACFASGDPACMPVDGGDDCAACMQGHPPYDGAAGCGDVTHACALDDTGCIPCNGWLNGGANPDLLCGANGPPDSLTIAIGLSDCACSSCAACASACAAGYLDLDLASFRCGLCMSSACAADVQACEAN